MNTGSQMIFKGKKVQYRKATICIKIIVLFFSFFYLSLAGNIIVYTPDQGTNRESTLIILFIKEKDADSGG